MSVSLEKRITRIVPVTPSFKGFLEPGYELQSFDLVPSEVEISGPASAVARVGDVQTDFIELAGRSSDFTAKVRVVRKEGLVSVSGPETVAFRAVVQRSLAIKSFEGLSISIEGLASGLALEQSLPPGSLRLLSSMVDIAGFSPPTGILLLDLSMIRRPGNYMIKVQTRAPDGFTIERYEPQSVQVTVVAAGEGGAR